jgi:hypothetical protein
MSKMVDSDNHAGVAFWGAIAEQGANKWSPASTSG